MSGSDNLSGILNNIVGCLSSKQPNSSKNTDSKTDSCLSLSPSDLLVIVGILADVLSVESVLIDKDQTVEILLSGSLKRKTELDNMLDEIGSMSFDEVLKAIMSRVT